MKTHRAIALATILITANATFAAPPNVILIITDDQGYGDVAAHGNRMIQTPNIDNLHRQSVRLTDFHVDPTCSPTRSALMTGRYSTRTGVWHTIMGRSIMDPRELTLAEMFKSAGYRTAMFGKWHLGDNYPSRPQDQGFDHVVYHGGGGVTQTPDHFGNDYFDDTYNVNGKSQKFDGYCTDVWFDQAQKFIEDNASDDANQQKPFFLYLATNAPHGPFLVADKYADPYRKQNVPKPMAEFYGMITNIDENVGRLTAKLDQLNLADNTILIFMTDNGTAAGISRKKAKPSSPKTWQGFNADMRGQKGSEYDGGHRVPCFIRWPAGKISPGRDITILAAHIDLLPTLADLCRITKPKGPPIDGTSLAPLIKNKNANDPDRTLFVHSQRLEHVEKWRKSAVMTKTHRLINGKELYHLENDPSQSKNIASDHSTLVAQLRQAYEQWWQSLSPVFDDHVRITIGHNAENPAHLTCHDWHTDNKPVPWNQGAIKKGPLANGFWTIQVHRNARYKISLRRWPHYLDQPIEATNARIKIAGVDKSKTVNPTDSAAAFTVDLPKGPAQLQTWLTTPDNKTRGAYFVEIERLES